MKVRIRIIFSYVFVLLLISSCANPYKVRQMPFSEPTSPNPNETLIYVFRENSAFGGARKFAIICNDTVMGVLTPGTFCNFKVRSGENEIVAYMSPSPVMHYRVQNRPGQTAYLFCRVGYTTGMFMEEIVEHKAFELMQEFKYTEIEVKNQKAKMNYREYYDNLYK
jgi:hypothetical protein